VPASCIAKLGFIAYFLVSDLHLEILVKSKALVASSLTSNKVELIRFFSYLSEFQVVGKHGSSFENQVLRLHERICSPTLVSN
jgi:hypothetical protein